ncbi:MAG TPA: sugar phosphate isomerase/epimerase family protein [Candidatus Paceibacterota bacterium]|nr:sugar phosphate isomerase/epimerase [Verrucomicrobiota bacterium]HOX03999.1 sugar phosphate isomerase/epimerase family protein [Verrucomicrobiota bacterium]HRZ46893.1 sugar phosphate isomerase/epimerase family protein [Candidatus Paceibacterota bacterium]HRZ91995.1 sugar phosphate isomerase/epimerase family protein [Candidatus Paceibacterota bacterium]
MKTNFSRREFLAAAAVAAGMSLAPSAPRARAQNAGPGFRTRLQRALIRERPAADGLRALQEAGYDGIEIGVLTPEEAAAARALAEQHRLKIHSVLRGWAEFNSSDQAKFDASYALSEAALRTAEAARADAVLLVPCRIGGMRIPRPWEFLIEFDDRTGHLERVVYGDNEPYAEYIRAHNHAIDTSRKAIERLIPLAEKTRVVIALENVWNNLWVQPALFRHFVASFGSPWVKAYLDIGNHVKYARPEEWILELGDRIAKVHIKDFKLTPEDPRGEGKFVNIRDGSVRWPVVRQALESIGYSGWLTIEGGDLSPLEHRRRLDLIIAGQ